MIFSFKFFNSFFKFFQKMGLKKEGHFWREPKGISVSILETIKKQIYFLLLNFIESLSRDLS